jgi:Conserved domain frequently associated with peptide methionine sulfoxide reductase
MDTTKKSNPVYSNTDTGKVVLSEEEWKKILPQDVYQIARMKGTERPWTSKFEKSKEIGTYYCAACGMPCLKAIPSLKAVAAGPVFTNPSAKAVSFIRRIIPLGWSGPKCSVAAVKPIWAMYLMMARHPPVYAIVSMG